MEYLVFLTGHHSLASLAASGLQVTMIDALDVLSGDGQEEHKDAMECAGGLASKRFFAGHYSVFVEININTKS